MPDIFISYSHKDGEYAHRLAAELRSQGLDVWIDDRIDYGDQWPRVIQNNLAASRVFIVIMSTNSLDSMWVQNEVSFAQENGKPIFPVLLEGGVWLSMAAMQYADVRGGVLPPPKFADKLKHALKGEATPIPEIRTKKTTTTRKRPIAVYSFIAGVLLMMGTGLGIWYMFWGQGAVATEAPAQITESPADLPTDLPTGPATDPPTDHPTDPATDPAPTDSPVTEPPDTEPPAPSEPVSTEFMSRDFHLEVGDKRVYKFGTASEVDGGVVEQLGDMIETVVDREDESNALIEIFRVERVGNAPGLDCQAQPGVEVQTIWYIRDETRLFTACDQDEKTVIVDALFREQMMFGSNDLAELSAPSYVFPITIDSAWNYRREITMDKSGLYGWHVDSALEQESTFAGAFENCYQISLRTNPDITTRTICNGIGMVSWFYRHFGTQNDSAGKLWSHNFSE